MNTHEPADGWVEASDGRRFWGRAGAAGLLAVDPSGRVLLQHRADWSHFGGTWGLPGGARRFDETAVEGALRESHEEAAVPADALRLLFASVLDLGFWSYTTVVARVERPFEPVVSDAESIELRWVPGDEVDALPLHPGFAATWPRLRREADATLHLVVDVANLVGSRPDGWWRDRVGATGRVVDALERAGREGLDGSDWHGRVDEPGPGAPTRRWPTITAVVEGQGRGVDDPGSGVFVVRAENDGDSAIVEAVGGLVDGASSDADARVVVVTADRALREAVVTRGAEVVGPSALRAALALD